MVGGSADFLGFKLFCEQVSYNGADRGTHGCTMDLFIILSLEEEIVIFKTELQQCGLYCIYVEVLFCSCVSCCSFCLVTDSRVHWNRCEECLCIIGCDIFPPLSLMDLMWSRKWVFLMWWRECLTSGLRILANSLATPYECIPAGYSGPKEVPHLCILGCP